MTENASNARTVGAWIWAVVAALCVIGTLTDRNFAGAALFAASGVLAVPPLRGWWARFLADKPRFWASVATGIAGFITIGATAPSQPAAPAVTASPSPAAQAAKPSLKDASSDIRRIEAIGPNLNVEVFIETAWDEVGFVKSAAMVTQAIGKQLRAGAAEVTAQTKNVNVIVRVPTTDRLGKDGEGRLATITFPLSDLREANFDNLSFGRTLNLASDVDAGGGMGRVAIAKYCGDPERLSEAPQFCTLALR